MVTDRERKLITAMVKIKLWSLKYSLFRTIEVNAKWGTRWLLTRLKKRQKVDDKHHAPGCPANHWHKKRLVFQNCTCGAL